LSKSRAGAKKEKQQDLQNLLELKYDSKAVGRGVKKGISILNTRMEKQRRGQRE